MGNLRHHTKNRGTRAVLTERAHIMRTRFNPATGKGVQMGRFVAAGGINDSGTFTSTFRISHGKVTTSFILMGKRGTIIGFTTATIHPYPSTTRAYVLGEWKFISGTDRYQGIQGSGKLWATIDFTTRKVTIAQNGFVRLSRKQRDRKIRA